MARTMFVNPSYKRRKKSRKARKSGGSSLAVREAFRAGRLSATPKRRRRNAGISSFVQNPLILSNPRRRMKRRNPPLKVDSLKSAANLGLSFAGGTAVALGANALVLSRIDNKWLRRGAQLGASILGAGMIGKKSENMAGAFAGAMMYPLLQDLMGEFLGAGVAAGVTAKEADLDALAADLEDVMDDMDDEELSDDVDDEDLTDW